MEIKKISQLPVAEALTENTNVLIETDGSTQRIPAKQIVPDGMVKSVNDIVPDEKGNISLSIPNSLSQMDGDAEHRTVTDAEKEAWNAKSDFGGSWNDLTDKPFGYVESEGNVLIDITDLSTAIKYQSNDTYQGNVSPAGEYVPLEVGKKYRVRSTVKGAEGVVVAYEENSKAKIDITEALNLDCTVTIVNENGTAETYYIFAGIGGISIPDEIKFDLTIAEIIEEIEPIPDTFLPTTVPVIQSATVGQTVVVKAVDENGKPTEWETVDMNILTDVNGVRYKLIVSTDGVLSAVAVA